VNIGAYGVARTVLTDAAQKEGFYQPGGPEIARSAEREEEELVSCWGGPMKVLASTSLILPRQGVRGAADLASVSKGQDIIAQQ
jgi:hypothetical protein